MHPLAPGFVLCTKPRHAPEIAHGCGDEPGCATWFDGETEWRYLPYESAVESDDRIDEASLDAAGRLN